jgi:site-specific DNA-methyltransferase (adenine-specific)
MTWLTSLLYAINAIRESKTIQNYLIDNFFRVIFAEALRICKPGSYVLAFSGTRTHHKLASAIESVGWEIRDTVYWNYGSGFPKSHNNFGIEGFGTALKPAVEPCLMAMKPLDGTFKQNAEKWGQAGINIDACRIPTEQNLGRTTSSDTLYEGGWKKIDVPNPQGGRWPANVIFDEEAAKMLDEQSGVSKPKSQREGIKGGSGFGYFDDDKTSSMKGIWPGDSGGGASRFFYCAKTSSRERNEGLEGMPDQKTTYMATSNGTGNPSMTIDDQGRERDRFSSLKKNNHPTVKPLKLMRYLITLVMPPKDGILLDPFAGSGSTIIAAHQLGVKAIGIEKQAEYVEIAKKRLEYYKSFQDEKEPDLFDKAINE